MMSTVGSYAVFVSSMFYLGLPGTLGGRDKENNLWPGSIRDVMDI